MSRSRQSADNIGNRMRNNAYTSRTMYTRSRGVGASIDGIRVQNKQVKIKRTQVQSSAKTRSTASHQANTTKFTKKPNSSIRTSHRLVDDVSPQSQSPVLKDNIQANKPALRHSKQPKHAARQPKPSPANRFSKTRNEVYELHLESIRNSADNNVVEKSFIKRIFKKPELKQSKQYYMTVMAAVVVFVFGIGISIHTFLMNRQVKQQVSTVLSSDTGTSNSGQLEPGALPDESDQDDDVVRNHQVAPDEPRYLRIPKIGVDHRVIQVGVNENNQLGAPAGIHDVGWYTGSAKPGQTGAVLMDGHVSGPTQPGVFRNLVTLNTGDQIEVERGDGEIIKYEVVKKKSYPYEETDMRAALVSAEQGRNGLNLITCAGKFNAQTNNYEDRLIVFAVEVE